MTSVDLIWLSASPAPTWPLGRVHTCADVTPHSLAELVDAKLPQTQSAFWLFWDGNLGSPIPETIEQICKQPGDAWHAGLTLGLAGHPLLLGYARPGWMFIADPPAEIEASSWKTCFSALLVKRSVLRQIGGPDPAFDTLDGSSLEWGMRALLAGVMLRHAPTLLATMEGRSRNNNDTRGQNIAGFTAFSVADSLRLVRRHFGLHWGTWALVRSVMTSAIPFRQALTAWCHVRHELVPKPPAPFHGALSVSDHPLNARSVIPNNPDVRVSVLIPTLERYPYLEVVLDQLRRQTVKPHEVIVVDQTAVTRRRPGLAQQFSDLPLKWFWQDIPGQCSSRNHGIKMSTGNYILFLDDDVEIYPNLIELHLQTLDLFSADVSSGIAHETGAGMVPMSFQRVHCSNVFPAGNSLATRSSLIKSGLFDMAYECGSQEDGDLGMRLYLSGALMVLSPFISVLHHHAPMGGLRQHKARVTTYASSRADLLHRSLPEITGMYLQLRYFPEWIVRESNLQHMLGTFQIHGPWWKRLLKIVIGLIFLPHTRRITKKRLSIAKSMLRNYPQIAKL